MKQIHENGFGAIQNACVLSLTIIMVMASFASTPQSFVGLVNTLNGASSNGGVQPSSSSSSYSAFPDDDPDSGKFLGVAGSGTLTNIPIICHIGVPAGETSFDLDVFDGDIGGHWDQYYDNLDYMDFILYEDPYKDGTGTTQVASWTHTNMVDDDWYQQSYSTSSGAKAPSGNYFYRFVIKWRNPGISQSNNYFKIRTTGQISIAKGDRFAVMGAPLRIPFPDTYGPPPWESNNLDPPEWAGDPDPDANNIDANSYNGDWNFYFYVPKACYSIKFKDGDADIIVDDDDANTPFPEGVSNGAPQDGPSPYDGCNVAPNIKYIVTDPDGNSYENLNPSGNMEWENFIISKNSTDNPDYLVSYKLAAGLWNMHYVGADAHNMNFIEASHEIFTTTDPPLPVNPPPTLVPSWVTTVAPGTTVNFAHTLTNNGASDIFDLTATSSKGWTTKIYHDADKDGVLDPSEISAGEVSNTGTLAMNATYYLIVQVVVPSGSGSTTDYTTVTASSQKEWNIQASVVDTTNVVSNQAPVADANGPYYADEGDTVQLDGSGSYDPDGDYLWYYWDLDDDSYYDDSTAVNPTYSWSEDGTYTVKLAVYDGEYWDFTSATVYVQNVPPEIYSTTYVYTLTQGSFTQTIPAVEKAQDPTSFYNYYSASAHTGFEKPYESRVFLYRDINTNSVSFFIIHDIDGDVYYPGVGYNSGSPDAECHMNLAGIPSGAYLAQSDDPGEFTFTGSTAQGTWHWWYNTDGGAIGGLPTGTSWSITITPTYWKDVKNWVYHYATGDHIPLNMSQSVTISYQAQTEPTTVQTDEGTSITLGAFARDVGSDDDPLDYKFEWNDPYDPGAESSGTTPWDTLFTATHTYHENGTFYPLLTVTDSDSATDTLTFTVIVNNVAPDVVAGADKTVDEGTPLSFSGTFSDPGAYDTHTATWDWGDGSSSSGSVSEENVPPDSKGIVTGSHTYLDDGTYYVTLTVEDDDGGVGQDSLTVYVLDLAPTANFTWSPEEQDEGSPVQFTDLSFSYPDVIVSWDWDFGDGGTSALQNPSHTYGDNEVYTVTLTVTDDDGSIDTISYFVIIHNVAPIVEAGENQTTDEGTLISFSGAFSDPGWLDTHTIEWDFGDGSSPVTGTLNPTHTYGDNGVYIVTLTVTDDDGGVGYDTIIVTVNNVAPNVEVWAVFYNGPVLYEGTPVGFSGKFNDPGWLDTHNATWDFGDGTVITGSFSPSQGGVEDPYFYYLMDLINHTYGDNGLYVVTLTVEDDEGGIGIGTISVWVYNVAPSVGPLDSYTIDENSSVTLNGSALDPGSDDLTFTWNWGYGTQEDITTYYNDGVGADPYPSPGGIYPFSAIDIVTHTYGDNGVYTITLTVEDDDGGVTITTTNVTVNNVAPTILNIEAYMYVNFSLRVAGEKWHSVSIYLYEDGSEIWAAKVTRYPGSPDEQKATITNVKIDMTKSYSALVDYLPNDPRVNGNVWGGNPVWIDMTFEDGSVTRLHHTFNVRQSDWNSDHWNHIDPWEVDFAPHFGGHNITFEASASDPGSDDLTFTWNWDDGSPNTENTHYNNGIGPDPYPSPEVNPIAVTDTAAHRYSSSGTYAITLTVTDDDGGIAMITLVLDVVVG